MNPFDTILASVHRGLQSLIASGMLPDDVDLSRVSVEPPRDPSHGDAATNAAMVLAKPARQRPQVIAAALVEALRDEPDMMDVEAVGPGFVNIRMQPRFWQSQIAVVLEKAQDYGRRSIGGGEKVNVEFCSANPTGPLHVGHARGTVFGDALASLLAFVGFDVTREYYVNDGGAQIEALARSIHLRYREALGETIGSIPEGLYPLEELKPVGAAIAAEDGDRWLNEPEDVWLDRFGQRGVADMLAMIKDDLAAAGVHHDVFTSERSFVEAGKVDAALEHLDRLGLIYTGTLPPPKGKPVDDWEPAEQLLFRSSDYGDDSDRPLKRSNGAWTYFAADVAYHLDKYQRGFLRMVDVLGADHGGYVKRMQAAVKASSEGKATLDCKLCQLVNLMQDGQPLKMSKRAGRIVTMRDVIDEVGKDSFRFIMLTRKNDAPLDFDLARVREQSKDNPVFYVQYAHARICSVFRNAAEEGIDIAPASLAAADTALLEDPVELALIHQVARFPRTVEAAALAHEPHRIAFYLHDLAGAFHGLWTRGRDQADLRFLQDDKPERTLARLAMLAAVRQVLATGLSIMGVTPVDEMR